MPTKTLKRIHPTSHAPYTLRFVEAPMETGSRAVEYSYSLAAMTYEYRVFELTDDRMWRFVTSGKSDIRSLRTEDEWDAAESFARKVI